MYYYYNYDYMTIIITIIFSTRPPASLGGKGEGLPRRAPWISKKLFV